MGGNLGVFLQGWAPGLPPMAKGRMDVVAWGLSRCLKGLGVVSWSTLGCSNMLQPPSWAFLSQLGNKARAGACFWGNCFCEGFPLLCPSPAHQRLCRARSWGLFAARRAISDGTPWPFGHQQGFFTLCMDKSFCISYNLQGRLCRDRWLSVEPSLCVCANEVLTVSGVEGCCRGDLTPGRTHGAVSHLKDTPLCSPFSILFKLSSPNQLLQQSKHPPVNNLHRWGFI